MKDNDSTKGPLNTSHEGQYTSKRPIFIGSCVQRTY